MGFVLTLTACDAVAFDGLGEDDGGLAFVVNGGVEGGKHFLRVVAAAADALNLLVGEHFAEAFGLRVTVEEVLADVFAGAAGVFLVLAVGNFHHEFEEGAGFVGGKEGIPFAGPEDFNDIPAGSAEDAFEFLDDFAVAAHRTIETLEVAVDDPGEVVKFFAGGKRDAAEGLGFVGLAIAEEGPDALARNVLDTTVGEVAVKAGVVDRHDRAEAHGDRGELPEVGHEPRVRVGAEAATFAEFAAEVF